MAASNKEGVVYNQDVAGLHARINRFIDEMTKSVSSSISLFNKFDQDRLLTYTNAITKYHDWVMAQPQLDLPETHPREYPLKANPVVPDIENESVKDVIRLLEVVRDELANCQSSRMPSGLVTFDSARLVAVIGKVEAFIKDFVQVADPLDLPESSPQSVMSGSGKTGV
jgi:hypothetical protein